MKINYLQTGKLSMEANSILEKLSVGDGVKGRVMEVEGNNIKLKTFSGQLLSAVLSSADIELQKGMIVELLITHTENEILFAKLNSSSKAGAKCDIETKIINTLSDMNIPINSTNIETALKLIKYEMPLNKELFSKILNLQRNVDYIDKNLLKSVMTLISTEENILKVPVEDMINLISEYEACCINAVYSEEAGFEKALNGILNTYEEIQMDVESSNLVKKIAAKFKNEGVSAEDHIQMQKKVLDFIKGLEIQNNDKVINLIDKAIKILSAVKNSKSDEIVYLESKDFEANMQNLNCIVKHVNGNDKIAALINKLLNKLAIYEGYKDEKVSMLKNRLEEMFLAPESIKDKNIVRHQIEKLVQIASEIDKLVLEKNIIDQEIRSLLTDIKDNLELIKIANNSEVYLQIPVIIQSFKTTAEIFVIGNRKKAKSLQEQSSTILIALDLKHAGHIESIVTLFKKEVNVIFRLENKKVESLIKKIDLSLKKALEDKGYNLKSILYKNVKDHANLLNIKDIVDMDRLDKLNIDLRV